MKTEETISSVCEKMGITKADLAKRMGVLPSSLYRKLARESMTLEELQKCLDVLGVKVEFNIVYPDGDVCDSKVNYEILLKRIELLEMEFAAAQKANEFYKSILRDLKTELNSAVGYAEVSGNHGEDKYMKKLQAVLSKMELTIAFSFGEVPAENQHIFDTGADDFVSRPVGFTGLFNSLA